MMEIMETTLVRHCEAKPKQSRATGQRAGLPRRAFAFLAMTAALFLFLTPSPASAQETSADFPAGR